MKIYLNSESNIARNHVRLIEFLGKRADSFSLNGLFNKRQNFDSSYIFSNEHYRPLKAFLLKKESVEIISEMDTTRILYYFKITPETVNWLCNQISIYTLHNDSLYYKNYNVLYWLRFYQNEQCFFMAEEFSCFGVKLDDNEIVELENLDTDYEDENDLFIINFCRDYEVMAHKFLIKKYADDLQYPNEYFLRQFRQDLLITSAKVSNIDSVKTTHAFAKHQFYSNVKYKKVFAEILITRGQKNSLNKYELSDLFHWFNNGEWNQDSLSLGQKEVASFLYTLPHALLADIFSKVFLNCIRRGFLAYFYNVYMFYIESNLSVNDFKDVRYKDFLVRIRNYEMENIPIAILRTKDTEMTLKRQEVRESIKKIREKIKKDSMNL